MNNTSKNLSEAMRGEALARAKYLVYAQKAAEEGLSDIAKLFREIAEAEVHHFENHLKALGIASTKENLESVIFGETKEFTEMYPKMLSEAESGGKEEAAKNKEAIASLTDALKDEKKHAAAFQVALDSLNQSLKE